MTVHPPARKAGRKAPTERMRIGQVGEQLALAHLESLGFTLVARNHRCPRGEVDLIVERGPLLVFVEVRTRTGRTGGSPLATVGLCKQEKVVRAARDWLARAALRDRELRFDVVGVVLGPRGLEVTHIPGAFDGGGDFTL